MNSTHRRWLRAATATVGAAALTFGGAVLPAAAADAPNDTAPQKAAVAKYDVAAASSGMSVSKLKKLEKQNVLQVTDFGAVYFIDPAPHGDLSGLDLKAAPEGAPISGDPTTGSRPGAPVTVYLDFDGETLNDYNGWAQMNNAESITFAPASATIRAAQAEIWASVAEDYAPFDVNVTTKRPSDDKLYKTSASDNTYGSHVIINGSYTDVLPSAQGAGGIAFLGATGSYNMSGALVFTEAMGDDPKAVAEAASHEAGHNFGLMHDGHPGGVNIPGQGSGEYYAPTEGVWGPIMGAGYNVPVTQWSNGDYKDATNQENDLAIITDRGSAGQFWTGAFYPDGTLYPVFDLGACPANGADIDNPKPGDVWYAANDAGQCTNVQLTLRFDWADRASYAADDFGNTAAAAADLDNADGSFEITGVIEKTDDADVFKLVTNGGTVSAAVEVADIAPNLNSKLTLTNSAGTVVATDSGAPQRVSDAAATGLGATVTADDLPAGTYYLTVDGTNFGSGANATGANAGGFSQYGSLGNYTLTGDAAAYEAPIVDVDITSPVNNAEVAGNTEITVSGTATPGATVTLSVGGDAVATAVVGTDGKWTAKVAVEFGSTTIVASQTVKGEAQEATDEVTVKAIVPAPVILAPANGSSTEDTTPTFSGTGVAGATLTLVIADADGNVIERQVTVADDGSWSLVLDTELALGTYSAAANQVIDGQASADSTDTSFTVKAADDGDGDGGGDGDGNGGGDGDGDGNGGGDGNNNNEDDDDLATTGSDFNAGIFALLGGAVLAIGAGTLFFARRRASQES